MSNQYYPGGAGFGGTTRAAGAPGYAVLVFSINGSFVKNDGAWSPIKQTWVKDNDIWKPTQGVYVNVNGTWEAVDGTFAPNFIASGGDFGYSSRPQGT